MSFWESILLGVIQGATEFLPVSSSGHLTLFGAILGVSEGEGDSYRFFVVMTHFGTLLAILMHYRRDLAAMAVAPFRAVGTGFKPGAEDIEALRLLGILALATLPAVILGLTFDELLERLFTAPLPAAAFLAVTGFILFSTRWTGPRATGGLNTRRGFVVGLAQAFAMLPGISRSGSTISAGLALGIKREEAARFAFLLAVPALLGAALFDTLKIESLAAVNWPVILAGTAAAFLSGWICLVWLLKLLARDTFWKFCWYCWGASILGVALFIR